MEQLNHISLRRAVAALMFAVCSFPLGAKAAQECSKSARHPEEISELVRKIADENGLDVRLAEGVARAESQRGQMQNSKAGALGIMQLMPATAAAYDVKDICDDEQNIRGGVLYLRDLLKEFHNNKMLALAAYNAGPSRVYKSNGVPLFQETALYVVKVLNYMEDFETKLKGKKKTKTPEAVEQELAALAGGGWEGGHVIDLVGNAPNK